MSPGTREVGDVHSSYCINTIHMKPGRSIFFWLLLTCLSQACKYICKCVCARVCQSVRIRLGLPRCLIGQSSQMKLRCFGSGSVVGVCCAMVLKASRPSFISPKEKPSLSEKLDVCGRGDPFNICQPGSLGPTWMRHQGWESPFGHHPFGQMFVRAAMLINMDDLIN